MWGRALAVALTLGVASPAVAAEAPGAPGQDAHWTTGAKQGVGTSAGIAFTRPDGKQLLRASDGDATGLKWLAGKKDCLKVKDGEGYCRD